MKSLLSASAKRLLSFALALVLLLSLCPVLPLTADAAVDADGWGFHASYGKYFETAQFISTDNDLVFKEGQAYDWFIRIRHTYGTSIPLSIVATITDSSGNTVGSYSMGSTSVKTNTLYDICKVNSFTDFDQNLPGTYRLNVTIKSGDTAVAWLEKVFTREGEDTSAAFTASSHSNPDMVFTYAEPIDLQLNITKTNGVAEGFKAVTTITNASGTVVSNGTYTIPSSTNINVSVKDLVDVTKLTTAGSYTVNVTLNNASGVKRYETTIPFGVVAMDRTVTVSISGNSNYADIVPDVSVNLQKDDGVAENFNVQVTVTNTETNSTVFTGSYDKLVPATGTSIQPDLSSLPLVGSFRMDVVAKDSDGITRGTKSYTFTRTNTTPLSATLTDNITGNAKTGMIYTDSDNPLALTITHPSSANKTLKIRYTGTYNGTALDEMREITMPSDGMIALNANALIKYGIYKDLQISIYNAAGTSRLWRDTKTYSFSFVRAQAPKGGMSLLNMNVHYTNITGAGSVVHMTNQVDFSALAGASTWRASIRWEVVEKAAGDYSMPTQLIQVMNQTKAQETKALIILAYNNEIYGDPNPNDPVWLNAYANYCGYVADYLNTNYPNQIAGFEIWNEWNNANMSKVDDEDLRKGDIYAKVVIAASKKNQGCQRKLQGYRWRYSRRCRLHYHNLYGGNAQYSRFDRCH